MGVGSFCVGAALAAARKSDLTARRFSSPTLPPRCHFHDPGCARGSRGMREWQRTDARMETVKSAKHASRMWLMKIVNLYPPFLGAGIRIRRAGPGKRGFDVRMKLTALKRNVLGSHFGGSLYAMCDPFFMLMVMENLGPGYVVWDKSASIDFLRPGRGRVRASFRITDAELNAIRDEVSRAGRAYPRFEVTIVDDRGEAVARIGKVLSVRRAGGRNVG